MASCLSTLAGYYVKANLNCNFISLILNLELQVTLCERPYLISIWKLAYMFIEYASTLCYRWYLFHRLMNHYLGVFALLCPPNLAKTYCYLSVLFFRKNRSLVSSCSYVMFCWCTFDPNICNFHLNIYEDKKRTWATYQVVCTLIGKTIIHVYIN